MNAFTIIDIPCCPVCADWLRPVLLIEYPSPASAWVCPNQHGSTVRDWGDQLDERTQYVFAALAQLVTGR